MVSPGRPVPLRGGRGRLANFGPALTDLEGRPLDRGHDIFGRYFLAVPPPDSAPALAATPITSPLATVAPPGIMRRPTRL